MLRTITFALSMLLLACFIECDTQNVKKVSLDFIMKKSVELDCSRFGEDVTFSRTKKNSNSSILVADEKTEINKTVATLYALTKADIIDFDYKCRTEGGRGIDFVKQIHPFLANDHNGASQTITEGGRVEFNCSLYLVGDGENEWTWAGPNNRSHNDLLTDTDRVKIIIAEDKLSTAILIKNLTRDYKGEYYCFVKNSFGTHSREFRLRVKDALAALWPFLAILAEVIILCVIILVYEKKCAKKNTSNDEDNEQSQNLMGGNNNNNADLKKRNAAKA